MSFTVGSGSVLSSPGRIPARYLRRRSSRRAGVRGGCAGAGRGARGDTCAHARYDVAGGSQGALCAAGCAARGPKVSVSRAARRERCGRAGRRGAGAESRRGAGVASARTVTATFATEAHAAEHHQHPS